MKILKAILGIFLFLFLSFAIHQLLLKREESKITSYGRKIQVLGKKMNVVEMGREGDPIIVLDPGYGTMAPGLDFKPFMKELSKNFHVYAIEPFGYGDSDTMDTPRTVENISVEFHEALKALGIQEYILRSHSISGIYSIDFLNKYPEGVVGFIGLDTSVPNQYKYMDDIFYPHLRKWASQLGLIRWISLLYPKAFLPTNSHYSNEDKEKMRLRLVRDFANDSQIDEGLHFQSNWEKIKDKYLSYQF